jgi:hypothetical protein
MDVDLVWFGIIVAMNLQTSFLTPPFGFALFYLRSVAPSADYDDRMTGKRIGKMTTGDIYRGSIAFVFIQLAMVAVVIAFPALTLGSLGKKNLVDPATVNFQIPSDGAPSSDGGGPIGMGNEAGADAKAEDGDQKNSGSDGKIDMGPAPGAEGTYKEGAVK